MPAATALHACHSHPNMGSFVIQRQPAAVTNQFLLPFRCWHDWPNLSAAHQNINAQLLQWAASKSCNCAPAVSKHQQLQRPGAPASQTVEAHLPVKLCHAHLIAGLKRLSHVQVCHWAAQRL